MEDGKRYLQHYCIEDRKVLVGIVEETVEETDCTKIGAKYEAEICFLRSCFIIDEKDLWKVVVE